MEEKIDMSNNVQKERYIEVKNKIIEKIKATKTSRSRTSSISSVKSSSSKRAFSGDREVGV